jgi:hypothetical protein
MEPLNGVMPGSGFHVRWLGLWADVADGVSVQNLQVGRAPCTYPPRLAPGPHITLRAWHARGVWPHT